MARRKSTLTIQQLISGQIDRKSTDWDRWLDCDLYTELSYRDGLFWVKQIDTTDTAQIPFWEKSFDSVVSARILFNKQKGET